MKKYKIGLLGFGTIGKGVNDLINESSYPVEITKILDLPINQGLIGNKYVSNYLDIISDNNIDIVIEAMGGNDFAYKCIKESLINHKHVITSNKEVVSNHLDEFISLAKNNNVKFLFEASVGGGIPIIYNLIENTKFNSITSIKGIINGTSNYIISLLEDGYEFSDALRKAQECGFAEKDPTADLEGLDMVRKIAILSDIAYDTYINPNLINHLGIKKISKDLIDYLKSKDLAIKFMASSYINDEVVNIIVMPRIIKNNHKAKNIRYENNIITFNATRNDELSFIGKGAGRYPTASAIISDVIKVIEGSYSFNLSLDKNYNISSNLINHNFNYLVVKNNHYEFTKGCNISDIYNYDLIAEVEE